MNCYKFNPNNFIGYHDILARKAEGLLRDLNNKISSKWEMDRGWSMIKSFDWVL
jgi:hypothetical protein